MAAGLGQTFIWASAQDILDRQTQVRFRITVDNGAVVPPVIFCDTSQFVVDNEPSCSITASPSPVSGDATIMFDTISPGGRLLDVAFEYSTNGVTWFAATAAGSSPIPGPQVGVAAALGQPFVWDSLTDLPGTTFGVRFRITVDNGAGVPPVIFCDTSSFSVFN